MSLLTECRLCASARCAHPVIFLLQGGPSGQTWTPIEHTDIRYDDDYARFYEAYSGERKLPPPVDGRTLYTELGFLQQQQQHQAELQVAAQQAALLGAATPPPSQAAAAAALANLMGASNLTPGGTLPCWPDSASSGMSA